ncbi:dienelactone hydrolase family protein [Acinetobacter nectaris]|uniref:dienelactone hydrolase family protein n=1 Tax=Acinetobacter nectaris TaxID=1219382 RepID=UPI001F42F4D4|nr:dienelactone hydrolase family protein [Acinetobacter nectaris]MCF9047320.1 dienelactone hydrolase family protein [Acinetobacter nectaris]
MTEIITREIEYSAHDGKKLIGFFAAPVTDQTVAGIIVGPEWWGRDEYTVQRTKDLAKKGYAALAIDMYGDKKTTDEASQAHAWMNETFAEPNTLVERANAALATLAAQPEVNPNQLAAIGFCFGGKVVLELARAGAPLQAVASFHGNLQTQNPAQKGVFKANTLICHGKDDSMVSLEDVNNIAQELDNADVKHHILVLENAKHGFMNPLADERSKKTGVDVAYNAQAEQKSLIALDSLLKSALD